MLHVSGFALFRCDRRDRIGGGCAVWVRNSMRCEEISVTPPFDLEAVFLILFFARIVLVIIYIPPHLAKRENLAISEFVVDEVDKILSKNSDFDVVVCGDLNRFDMSHLSHNLNLVNCNNKPTYGDAELDFILLSEPIAEYYDVDTAAPLDISKIPHASLLANPKRPLSMNCNAGVVKKVFDLRKSNIQRFLTNLGAMWTGIAFMTRTYRSMRNVQSFTVCLQLQLKRACRFLL